MLTMIIVTFVKVLASLLLTIVFSVLSLPELLFPSSFFDPVLESIQTIVSLLIWLFGRPSYSFFILTVITVTFSLPVLSLSYFLVHFFSRSKGLVK